MIDCFWLSYSHRLSFSSFNFSISLLHASKALIRSLFCISRPWIKPDYCSNLYWISAWVSGLAIGSFDLMTSSSKCLSLVHSSRYIFISTSNSESLVFLMFRLILLISSSFVSNDYFISQICFFNAFTRWVSTLSCGIIPFCWLSLPSCELLVVDCWLRKMSSSYLSFLDKSDSNFWM